MLTERLRTREAEGLIYRHAEPTVPPKETYGLTALGRELDASLKGMNHMAGRVG